MSCFPRWMPWRRFAVSQDVFAEFDQVGNPKDGLGHSSGRHVTPSAPCRCGNARPSSPGIKQAAATALATTKMGETLNPLDKGNPWAVMTTTSIVWQRNVVNTLTPNGPINSPAMTFHLDQCYSMEQTLRIDWPIELPKQVRCEMRKSESM